jgi:hypothetical protein
MAPASQSPPGADCNHRQRQRHEPRIASAERADAGPTPSSTCCCDRHRLHDVLDHISAKLLSHVLPDHGREPVVETGPDPRLRYFVGVGAHVGETVRDPARSGWS